MLLCMECTSSRAKNLETHKHKTKSQILYTQTHTHESRLVVCTFSRLNVAAESVPGWHELCVAGLRDSRQQDGRPEHRRRRR